MKNIFSDKHIINVLRAIFTIVLLFNTTVVLSKPVACTGVAQTCTKDKTFDKTIGNKLYSCYECKQVVCKDGGNGGIAGTKTTSQCTEKATIFMPISDDGALSNDINKLAPKKTPAATVRTQKKLKTNASTRQPAKPRLTTAEKPLRKKATKAARITPTKSAAIKPANSVKGKSISQDKATQWMVGANSTGTILPKRAWLATAGRNYNLKNLERRRFLQYEKQGTARGINLGWTNNASSSTATKRAKWFFARQSDSQSAIRYGERIAIGWGDRDNPFIRYAKRNVGINLNWSKTPIYEWVFIGGEIGQPVKLGEDRVVIYNMKHREPLIYFNRTMGANIGWPDSTKWDGPTDEIIDGLAWTANELVNELKRMVLVCKGSLICQAKIKAYQGYMIQLRTGVKHYKLPKKYQDLLAKYYPEIRTLKQYQFGYAKRQPKGNATTDCHRTYFNDSAYVDRLRAGRLTSNDFKWLLHEIEHYNQCRKVGGRSKFAKMWFGDLQSSLLNGNVSNMKKIHDAMPMEEDAARASELICNQLAECK